MAEKKKMNPNSLANLTYDPNAGKTPEQRKESASRAGKASGEARRRRREMRNILDDFLSLPMKRGKELEEADAYDASNKLNLTISERIMMAQIKKAVSGDTKAAEFIRDTAGQKAPQQIKATVEADPLVDIIKQMQEPEEKKEKEEKEEKK